MKSHPNRTLDLKLWRLSGLASTLELRLQEAAANRLSHAKFLSPIRAGRAEHPHAEAAGFREVKTLDGFEWEYNPKLPKSEIYELATGQFIPKTKCALFIGQPRMGKSHLSQAIGCEAIKQGYGVVRKSIFDLVP